LHDRTVGVVSLEPPNLARRITMLRNATYDLMETAAVLSKGLHRYDTFQKDSQHCLECQRVWAYMRQTDEEQLKRLVHHLKEHFAGEGDIMLAAS
jgi:hypothetical protein